MSVISVPKFPAPGEWITFHIVSGGKREIVRGQVQPYGDHPESVCVRTLAGKEYTLSCVDGCWLINV